jgi:hypothetical protein
MQTCKRAINAEPPPLPPRVSAPQPPKPNPTSLPPAAGLLFSMAIFLGMFNAMTVQPVVVSALGTLRATHEPRVGGAPGRLHATGIRAAN